MPAFCRFYGLKPVDIEDMTMREITEFQVYLDRAHREAEQQRRQQGG